MIEAKNGYGANVDLIDEESIKIIMKLAKQGSDSAAIYTQQNRADLADAEMAQVAVLTAICQL